MNNIAQIIGTSIVQALQELRVNKLRTFLSLLGITIGIFCVIAVLTSLDSAQGMIQKRVNTLGSDVLHIDRWPWPGVEEGEYKWWEYWRRPSMTKKEVTAINSQLHDIAITTLCLPVRDVTLKHDNLEVSSIRAYCVTTDFDKAQNVELSQGRYLSVAELEGGNSSVILGFNVADGLFPKGINPIGKNISLLGRKYQVIGVIKKAGQDMAGFDPDNGVILPYNAITSSIDVRSLEYNPSLIIKAYNPNNVTEVKDEARGILRRMHKIRPDQADDFSVNQLTGISKMLDGLFGQIKGAGLFIGLFSLLVGAFGIANIMFVTVKERTKIIGLKKAIGARKASIQLEFLSESVVLCLVGGLIGILLVLVISMLVSRALDMEIVLSLQNFGWGVSMSFIVGVLAGYIPARSASRMDPVVAIRTN